MAAGAVHQYTIAREIRTKFGLVVESGEARDVHHHCLLIGYGVDAINPYMAFAALEMARTRNMLDDSWTDDKVVSLYRLGVAKGMLKVLAKMGISTLQSYKGAQIFEAVGLDLGPVDLCFTGTASRIRGVGFDVLASESLRRHQLGFPTREQPKLPVLPNTGQYHWR